jgi:cobalt-zinc-cadmium efflux system outer membrane protein
MSLWLPACASASPDDDLRQLAAFVAERTGAEVDLVAAFRAAPRLPLPPGPLSAGEAVRLALANHPDLRDALGQAAAARAAYAGADRAPNPMAELMIGVPIDGGASGRALMAAFMQPLAFLWQRGPRLDAAAATLEAALLHAADVALERAAQARLAHARLTFAERDLELARAAAELSARAATATADRAAAGEAADLDAARARLVAAMAADAAIRGQAARDEAARDLLAAVGHAEASAQPISDGVVPAPDDLIARDEGELVTLAEQHRPALWAARARVAAATAERALAATAAAPRVDAGARAERERDGMEAVYPGVAVELPLYDAGGPARAGAEAARLSAVASAEAERQRVLLEVRRARTRGIAAAERSARYASEWLPAARAVAGHAAAAAAEGVIDPLAAVAAETESIEVQRGALAADLEAASARIELERAVGASPVAGGGEGGLASR